MSGISSSFDPIIHEISRCAFADETECVKALVSHIPEIEIGWEKIASQAERYIHALRAQKPTRLEMFLNEYGLSNAEGLAILALAEALLRIPDAATADALIEDKLKGGDWKRHITEEQPWLLRAAGKGLSFASSILNRSGILARLGEPVIRAALKSGMRVLGEEFVMGADLDDARKHAAAWRKKGYAISFDILGEGARSSAQAEQYWQAYLHAAQTIDPGKGESMSVKLSALHPRFELVKYKQLKKELLPRLLDITAIAKDRGVLLTVDAEEMARLDVTLLLFRDMMMERQGSETIGIAVQAYHKRALPVIEALSELAGQTGGRIPVRLVKGAYWDSEIKRAQMAGLQSFPVFTRKEHTDISYLACAAKLFAHDRLLPQFATHNAVTVAAIQEMAQGRPYEFQRLHGMGERLYDLIIKETRGVCRIYAPVGPHRELLAYLIRRLLENGANNSFVHHLTDRRVPVDSMLKSPAALSRIRDWAPATLIYPPDELYTERKNSSGLDFGNLHELTGLTQSLKPVALEPVRDATEEEAVNALKTACDAFESWAARPVEERAAMLERMAGLLEAHKPELTSLCVAEGKKTLADSIAEIREAIDFCRYYAAQARTLFKETFLPGPTGETNRLTLHPRGVFVAISPWNFPLAIFTGQVAVALVTGNTVIAKPANQTPRIATMAARLMHEAGVPKPVLQLLTGPGGKLGPALVQDPRVAGVVFTGSTDTAWQINETLAKRRAPIGVLIAETGGVNCMIVDSSALIEQTVDDIILSAFNSAGQRCSALRVLYVQEEIADRLLALLAGAMQELKLGDPADPATDIGPVIEEKAREALQAHIDTMRAEATLIGATPLESSLQGAYVAPHAFELQSIAELPGEVFGPILHVIRFKLKDLDKIIQQINATGFGLTFGIQSRVGARADYIAKRIRAGNIYINRSMIGAVVGTQPFGGERLSGTGPKAGGPHYLSRFCTERVVTTNTAAIGGNIEMLSGI